MPRPQKIPPDKIELVKTLDLRLDGLLFAGELKQAKQVLDELRGILRPYHHNARIMQGYVRLLEAALESWQLDIAKRGFRFVRSNMQNNTRLHLEATALLAIAHLKDQDAAAAEPLMAEVFKNTIAIKSARQREIFCREIIGRLDQEAVLAALTECPPDQKTEADLHRDAVALVREGEGIAGIYNRLGAAVPQSAKAFLLEIDQLAKSMLPDEQRVLLPSPNDVVSNSSTGGIVFVGVKRKLYRHLCNEKFEVQHAGVRDGLEAPTDTAHRAAAVLRALTELRIVSHEIAVGVTAAITHQGVKDFCEKNRPYGLVEIRQKSA